MQRSSAWVMTFLLLAVGCGRAAPEGSRAPIAPEEPAQSPAPAAAEGAGEEEPTTLEEAEAALSRAKGELDSALNEVAFAEPPAADMAQGAPAPAAAPPPAGAAAPSRPREEKAAEAERAAEPRSAAKKDDATNCQLACRAYGSLTRAVDAVCRLDAGGERCARARRVASDAEARVASCSCQR